MKRKAFALFLALAAILSLTVPVSADLLVEPIDSFYEKHRNDCTDVGHRRYELAGYDGTVTVFTAPGGMNKATLDNGAQGTIQLTWEGKGTTWGYLYWVTDSEVEGWVPMDDVTLVYDSQEFIKDHADEITETEPLELDFHEAVCYSYPNGPSGGTLKEVPDHMTFQERFTEVYTDGAGLRWSYTHHWGRVYWVCLDDPMNEELNGGIVPCAPSAAQLRGSATVPAGPPILLIAGVLVAGVAAVTGALVLKLKKRTAAA